MKNNTKGLPWHTVESAILLEKKWLEKLFDFNEDHYKESVSVSSSSLSSEEMMRQLCISIIKGEIKAREMKSPVTNGLWTEDENWEFAPEATKEHHGGNWHRSMMAIVKKHFLSQGFDVINEPYLNHGRADLGVYKDGYKNLYVEIGSTSLAKTWLNLSSMQDSIFLFVPSVYYALEFEIKKSG